MKRFFFDVGEWLDRPWSRFGRDVLICLLVVLGLVNQRDIRSGQQEQRREAVVLVQNQHALQQEAARRAQASFRGCQQANGARRALVNLLVAVDRATMKQPPSAQRAASLRFFHRQSRRIHFTDCSVYRHG